MPTSDQHQIVKRNDLTPGVAYALLPLSTDLTDAVVVFHMKNSAGDVVIDSGPGQVLVATGQPKVGYMWAPGDTAVSGIFYGEFQVTFANGRPGTFPNKGFITVEIPEDIS